MLLQTACSGNGTPGAKSSSSEGTAIKFPLEQPIELKIFGIKNANIKKEFGDLQVFKNMQKNSNVNDKWDVVSANDFTEKKNLIFASMDLPDAFYGRTILTDSEVVKYGIQGLLIPLEDLIKKHAPNLSKFLEKRPDIRAQITAPDGHIYALPSLNEFDPTNAAEASMFVNKQWLDKLGLSVPKTTEELYTVLKAFKQNDMNGNGKADEIPLSFNYRHGFQGVNALSGSFGKLDRPDNHLHVEKGKVYFTPMEPEYKEYVKYLHRLYSEGLIDVEAFTHTDQVYSAKIAAKEPNIGVLFTWARTTTWGEDPNKWVYVPVPALKGPAGDQLWLRGASGLRIGAFAITSQNKYPEITMKWIDQVYDELTSAEHAFGPSGTHIYDAGGGKLGIHLPKEGMTTTSTRYQEAPGNNGVYIIGDNTFERTPAQLEKRELLDFYEPFLPKETYPTLLMSVEDVNTLNQISSELTQKNGLIESTFSKWVVNGNVDKEWDSYIKQLKRMNIDQLVEIYQRNYDHLQKSMK